MPDRLVWSDEFSGASGVSPAASRWTAEEGGHGWGNNELQSFTGRPQNLALDGNGNLAITARRETYTGRDGHQRNFTSSRIHTKGRFSFTYGRLEARIKIPAGQGLWPAFWAMGDNVWDIGWPNSGEFDVMETLGHDPTRVHGTLHGPIGTTETAWKRGNSTTSPTSLADGFHVYGLTWRHDSFEWTLDGRVYSRLTRSDLPTGARWVFDRNFFIILNLSVGGNWPGAPDASTPFPSSLLVDWVRVYQ